MGTPMTAITNHGASQWQTDGGEGTHKFPAKTVDGRVAKYEFSVRHSLLDERIHSFFLTIPSLGFVHIGEWILETK